MPRAVVITKLDHARANYDNALAAAQKAFGDKVLPLYLPADSPVHRPDRAAVADALRVRRRQAHHDACPTRRTPIAIEELRGTLIEGIIEESEDETLMERYLGGEEIDQSVLIDDLEKAVARGSFFPVIPVCSGTGVGTLELLEIATSGFPSPLGTPAARGVHAAGQGPQRTGLRPERAAARRGGQDDVGPLRRQGQPGPGVLRHHQARRDGARVGPFLVRSSVPTDQRIRLDGRPRRPRRGRAHRHAVVPARQAAAARARRWWRATSARSAG